MKLLSCHIENFGKLKNFTYYFEDDLNVLFAENGWGKSTFAAFLKVMFYGFEGENRRNEEGNERLRYRPWGGGVFGGSVTWSRGPKIYRMMRTFGTRRGEDTFVLCDDHTGLVCNDFSDRIGEELFGIDRDSFCRTVFWSQSDHETSSTTSIQAKIGDLSSQQDDLPAYDAAVKRLRREMERLRPDRASGLIRKKEEKLTVLEADENRIPSLAARLEDCGVREPALEEELNMIRARRRNCALSASENAAPVSLPSDERQMQAVLQAKKDLSAARERLSRLSSRQTRIKLRGQMERREYLRAKKELRQELSEQERSDEQKRAAMRAGAVLCAALSAITAALCISGLLPTPALIPAVLLLSAACGLYVYAGASAGAGTDTEEIRQLRREKARHRNALEALRGSLENTEKQIRAEEAVFRAAETRLLRAEEIRDRSSSSLAPACSPKAAPKTVSPVTLPPDTSELLSELDRQEEDCRLRLQDVRQQSEELRDLIRDCRESAALIPGLREEINDLRDRYDTCRETLAYLEEARNQFTSRYMNPFLRSFGRYYSMLTGESADDVRTDADFSITIMDGGLPRNPSLMSEGTGDLISLCRRMAMIDAMYPGEKPFLVLDDPFSNLDDERVKGGLRFLHSASLEYQILYLTCHASRF